MHVKHSLHKPTPTMPNHLLLQVEQLMSGGIEADDTGTEHFLFFIISQIDTFSINSLLSCFWIATQAK